METLRDHYEGTFLGGPQFDQYLPDFQTVCMHDSPSGFTWGDTATSVIVELDAGSEAPPLCWVAYLPPCGGIYLPFALADGVSDTVTRCGTAGRAHARPDEAPRDGFDARSLWWRMHRLLQSVKDDPVNRHRELRSVLDPIEAELLEMAADRWKRHGGVSGETWNGIVSGKVEEIISSISKLERAWEIDPKG